MNDQSTVVPVQLENGAIIRIQATQIGSILDTSPAVGDEIESDVSFNLRPLREVTDSIKGIAQTIKEAIDEVKPDKASVEFAVEFGYESGELTAMIVKGTGSANLKICLQWGKEK